MHPNAVKCDDLLVGENKIPGMVAWFDIECCKQTVDVPSWPQKRRTVPFFVGVMLRNSAGNLLYVSVTGEEAVIAFLQKLTDQGYELRYSATHNYDEMVVTARWLYIRRRPLDRPGPWPRVVDGSFRNIRRVARKLGWQRGEDIASRDIPEASGDRRSQYLIAMHNWRDVLLLVASDPDVELSEDSQEMFQAAVK